MPSIKYENVQYTILCNICFLFVVLFLFVVQQRQGLPPVFPEDTADNLSIQKLSMGKVIPKRC